MEWDAKEGVEVIAHSLRDTLNKHKDSNLALLKIDFKNAFNKVRREHFVPAACKMFPAMTEWTEWCHGQPSTLLYDHQWEIESTCGVQQGDPLGPLYFCCGINGLVNEILALKPVYNKWYMDDGGIIGNVELLQKAWKLLLDRGPEMGLELNPSVKLVPRDKIEMLGVPLGSKDFPSDYVKEDLLTRLMPMLERLEAFEDTQAAIYLLRVSFSIVRRTTCAPPHSSSGRSTLWHSTPT